MPEHHSEACQWLRLLHTISLQLGKGDSSAISTIVLELLQLQIFVGQHLLVKVVDMNLLLPWFVSISDLLGGESGSVNFLHILFRTGWVLTTPHQIQIRQVIHTRGILVGVQVLYGEIRSFYLLHQGEK